MDTSCSVDGILNHAWRLCTFWDTEHEKQGPESEYILPTENLIFLFMMSSNCLTCLAFTVRSQWILRGWCVHVAATKRPLPETLGKTHASWIMFQ